MIYQSFMSLTQRSRKLIFHLLLIGAFWVSCGPGVYSGQVTDLTMFVLRYLHFVLSDIITPSCLHRFLLEFLGSTLFLSVSLSAVVMQPSYSSHLPAAICVGGGAHLNPAITLAMALTSRLRLWRAVLYVIGQLLGGVASAALLVGLTGDVTRALNQVSSGIQLHQAFAVETLITLQVVLVVMVTTDAPLPDVAPPLLVGLAISLGHLVAVSVTGCGMNPARSFGPAVITLNFNNHWVFWVGPSLGACLAAFLNDLLLRPRWHRPGDWWVELKQLYVLTEKQQQVASHLP